MNNYFGFYGLIDNYIISDISEKFDNNFIQKEKAINLFDSLFKNLKNYKYWLLSYNNSSYPDKDQLIKIISVYSNDIQIIERKHNYQITGKDKKEKNKEFLFIIKNKNYD